MELSSATDVDLLAGVQERDEGALHELFDRHSAWLTLRLQRRSPSADLVASALQETFLAVWRRADSFRGEGDVGAWLWGIAIRQLLMQLRRPAAPSPLGTDLVAALTPTEVSAEDQLLVAVEHGTLGDALRTLSPELRQAMQATVIDGLTTREAAALLGVPQGTVKSRVRLAKVQLRRQLISVEGW